jgi:tetratricopeptide (TPR) repeat protein
MLRISFHLAVVWLFSIASLRARARAEDVSEAQLAAGNELLAAGKAAFGDGRYNDALYDYEQAYQRTQRPSVLYRIGDTADKLGAHERAISAFQQYLAALPTAKDAEFVQSRIAANREALRVNEAPAPNTGALSPVAAAETAADSGKSSPLAVAPSDRKDLARAWWLWAGAGTLAVATIVIVAVLVGSSSTHQVAPIKGNVGGTIHTLEGPSP